MSTKYNLDNDKFVTFTLNGNEYHFYFPTLEQSLEAQQIDKDNKEDGEKAMDFMFDLVEKPAGAEYPEFKDVAKQMNVRQLNTFRQMVETELGGGTA